MPVQNLPGLALDRSHPLARGLVGWWPMNERGGARVTDLVNGNAGSFANITPGSTSGWAGSFHGAGVMFDGTDDFVTIPHTAQIAITADFTCCAWLIYTSRGNYRSVMLKGNAGAGYPNPFQLTVETTTGKLLLYVGDGASQGGVDGPVLPMGVPLFVCGVRSGTTMTVYVNGTYGNAASVPSQPMTDGGTAIGIGGRPTGTSYPMLGTIWNTRLYNRALSTPEIEQLYADPFAAGRAPRAARYYVGVAISPPAAIAAPPTADRLWNRGYVGRIFRRGEKT